ncbi:MAG TPA: YwiC-like family protein [Micromonosporaceae bacterium]|jgi:hypothetical protein
MTTKAVRKFLPPQHGAWAMLLLPWLAGTIIAGFRWLDVPLLLAWLTGYLASYYALLSVKTRRPGKVRAQLWLYGTPTVLLGALVLALRPPVLWYAPAYGLLLAVNVGYAARREDRALVNDLASVVQSCLMVFVCATVAAVPLDTVAVAFAALTAYFVGVVLHVKALIRERGNPRYRWASLAYHLAAFVASVWFGLALAIVFGLLAVRAWAMAGRKLRPGLAARAFKPGTLGIVEVIASLALLGALVVS